METNSNFHSTNYTVYPGEYSPRLDTREVNNELKKPNKVVFHSLLKLIEHNDHFKIEAIIPGMKREDFYIDIDEDILSIAVVHKNNERVQQGNLKAAQFDCFNEQLILPHNTEKDFVKAEYNDGLLCLYFLKSDSPGDHLHSNVIVY